MPPAWTENARALTRGLTHTIRCASRASRSISRADQRRVAALPAVGEDHHDRAARHPAPPVAVVERLQRVADAGAARPVWRRLRRALDRALRIARGERPRQPGQPRREHEGLGGPPAGAGEELEIGAGVRLHRAGDVAQQHEPRRWTTRRRRRASRIGSPPVRRLSRSVRRMSIARAMPRALVAARAALRRLQPQPRHQRVEVRELVGLQRVEALLRQPLLGARPRHRHLDLAALAAPRRGHVAALLGPDRRG